MKEPVQQVPGVVGGRAMARSHPITFVGTARVVGTIFRGPVSGCVRR